MGNIKAGNLEDPESGETLSDVESVLSGIGIKLRNSNSDFRNFGDVLDEVGGKWESYSTVQQRAIAAAFAGTRQQEKFLVLMENYDQALEYMEVSAESAGTAAAKYQDAYLSGIEAAQNRLTASFEELSTTAIDGGVIASFYDLGSIILEIMSGIIKLLTLFDGLPVKVLAFVASIGLAYRMVKFLMPGGSLIEGIKSIIYAFISLTTGIEQSTIASMGLKGVWDSLKSHPVIFAISILAAAGSLISSLYTTSDEYREEAANIAQESRILIDETSKLKTELDQVNEKIKEIQSQGTITLTDNATLNSLKRENAELERQIANNEALQKQQIEKAKTVFSNVYEDETEDFSGYARTVLLDDTGMVTLSEQVSTMQTTLKNLYDSGYQYGTDSKIDTMIDEYEYAFDYFMALSGSVDTLFASILNRQIYDSARLALENLSEVTSETVSNLYDTNDNFVAFIQHLMSLPGYFDWETILGDQFSSIDTNGNGTIDIAETPSIPADKIQYVCGLVANEFNSVGNAIEDVGVKSGITAKEFSKLYDELEESIDPISKAYQELNSDGKLSIETIFSLLNKHQDLVDSLTIENGQYTISKNLLQEKFEAQKKLHLSSIEKSKRAIELEIAEQKSIIETIKLQHEKAAVGISGKDKILYKRDAKDELSVLYSSLHASEKELNKIQAQHNIISNMSIEDFSSNSSSSKKTAGDLALDAWKKKLDAKKHELEMGKITESQYYTWLLSNYKKDLKNYDETLDERRSIEEDYFGWLKDKYKEDLESQKDELEKKKDQLKEYYDKQKEMIEDAYDDEEEANKREEYAKDIAKLETLISQLRRDTTQEAMKKLAETEAELSEKKKEYEDWERENAKTGILDALDEEYESREAAIDKQIDDIDTKVGNLDKNTSGIYGIIKQWAAKAGYTIPPYASGTASSAGGLALTQERGSELLGMNIGSGQFTYLTPHSKVWSAAATDILYQFANAPGSFLSRFIGNITSRVPSIQSNAVSIGDIIINGKADSSTVAELRKERSKITYEVLEQFKKLKA